MTAPDEAYDFPEASRRLNQWGYGISERFIREHIGEFPHVKVGRKVRFTDALLREYLDQQTRRPGPARRMQPAGGRRRAS